MAPNETDAPSASEVVGLFAAREDFERTIEALMTDEFERTDLSVLSSHESIDAAGTPGKPWKDVLTALVGELKYEGPLIASGAILLAGGPLAATIAGIIGAATAGIAAKEVLGEVTSTPHTEDFARSLAAGSVILWVRALDDRREKAAARIMGANGGQNIHVHQSAA